MGNIIKSMHLDQEIVFNEDSHTYTVNEKSLISASSIVKKLFPEFDKDTISKRVAEKEGVSQANILLKWEMEAEKASLYGKKLHKYIEDSINEKETDSKGLNSEIIDRYLAKIICQVTNIESEKIVFNTDLEICGTIDFFALKKDKENKCVLIDWKTNKKIETMNNYMSFGLGPASNVPNINYHHYSIQLSIYAYILRKSGYVSEDTEFLMYIAHFPSDNQQMFKSFKAIDYIDRVPEFAEFAKKTIKI